MIIVYSFVLLIVSNLCLAMEKSGKPLPPNPHIANYECKEGIHFPAARKPRIKLTPAEKKAFLNAKKVPRTNLTPKFCPTAQQVEMLNNTCKSSKNALELLELSDKLNQQYELATHNLNELKKMKPHLNMLGVIFLPLTHTWQVDSLAIMERIQSLTPALTEIVKKCDADLDDENPV